MAVNAHERILGPAISVEEAERIRSQGIKRQEVLYEAKQNKKVENLPPIVK